MMNILLAVDGSNQAYDAVKVLAHLAPPRAMHLVHVMDVPVPMYPSVFPEVAKEIAVTVEQGMREAGDRLLNRVASLLPPGVGPVSRHLIIGKPTEGIVDLALREHIDLIVMGGRGLGPVREVMMGSVSHRVISRAGCSVLVVQKPIKAMDHIVLAVESPEDVEASIAFLKQRPFKQPCGVTVLTVIPYASPAWPVGAMIPDSLRDMITSQAREFVAEASARLAAEGYRSTGEVAFGAPAMEIGQEARKCHADLIMLGSQRKGVERLVLGSVAHTLLHRAECPVLIFR